MKLILSDGRLAEIVSGMWSSQDPYLEKYLAARFPITDSPADGTTGIRQLQEAAYILGGRTVVNLSRQPDLVY